MIAWVMYDITNDRARNRVAKYCKQAGLYRVQYSVFLGTLNLDEKDVLALQIEQELDLDTDKVYIFPMSETALKQTTCLGQALDKKLVTDQVKALFF
ncbi:MAG: CRISPR-associated endonuclease Cas2 [Bacteroidetes bacterium]|nr:MAG: CRISPR-associated endonuclease Cas2 [Bacteroidota bacterium]